MWNPYICKEIIDLLPSLFHLQQKYQNDTTRQGASVQTIIGGLFLKIAKQLSYQPLLDYVNTILQKRVKDKEVYSAFKFNLEKGDLTVNSKFNANKKFKTVSEFFEKNTIVSLLNEIHILKDNYADLTTLLDKDFQPSQLSTQETEAPSDHTQKRRKRLVVPYLLSTNSERKMDSSELESENNYWSAQTFKSILTSSLSLFLLPFFFLPYAFY